jgi:hypothetical protein
MGSLIPPIPSLQTKIQPWADSLGLHALPLHVHEIFLAFAFYHFIFKYLAPSISILVIPNRYRSFNFKTSLKWNVQCVSMVQSILICTLALTVMSKDEHRKIMTPEERVWAYDGPAGTVQAFATGYFVWDLVVSLQYINDLGILSLIHALSCLAVYSLGFVSVLPIQLMFLFTELTYCRSDRFSIIIAAFLSSSSYQRHF